MPLDLFTRVFDADTVALFANPVASDSYNYKLRPCTRQERSLGEVLVQVRGGGGVEVVLD